MVWDLLAMLKLMLDDLCDLLQHSACVRYSLEVDFNVRCCGRFVLFDKIEGAQMEQRNQDAEREVREWMV